MKELDSYLQEQSSEGKQQEPGAFTIDSGRAWELLSAQAQPFPEAWVLKLVQAACAAGCAELRVVQQADTTTFTFKNVDWSWPGLTDALSRVAEGATGTLNHLATALLWLAKDVGHAFVLSLPDNHLVKWDESDFSVEKADQSADPSAWLRVEHESAEQQASLLGKLTRKGAHFSAAVSLALHHRAYTSSVPIYIDSRHLAGLHHNPKFSANRDTRPLLLLSSAPNPALPAFSMPLTTDWDKTEPDRVLKIEVQGAENAPSEVSSHGTVTLLAAFLKELRAARGYFSTKRDQKRRYPDSRSCFILWVLDGVVIREEELPLTNSVGFATAVSAHGLRTDLSGFGLVQDEALAERKKTALQSLHAQLGSLCESDLSIDVGRQGTFYYKSQVFSAVIGLLVFLPVGLFLGANARKVSKQDTILELEMEKIYRLGLEELKDKVGELTNSSSTV